MYYFWVNDFLGICFDDFYLFRQMTFGGKKIMLASRLLTFALANVYIAIRFKYKVYSNTLQV